MGIGRCGLLSIVLALCALIAISFGISWGVEVGLTGEGFGAKGHNKLFRICETDTTSASLSRLHTCNVFAPGIDPNAPPKHAFTELNQHWYTRYRQPGSREAWTLEQLLETVNLECSVTDPAVATRTSVAQILIGDVGQCWNRWGPWSWSCYAIACNYRSNGSNMQNHCGRYRGGVLAGGHKHPLSINQIFSKHFGRGNCSFVH